MKELYGMFVRMEEEERQAKTHDEDNTIEMEEKQQARTVGRHAKAKVDMLPEVPTSP